MAKAKNTNFNVTEGLFETESTETTEKAESRAISNANLRTRTPKEKEKKIFMQLNVAEYDDYIYRMAKVNNISMTQYVIDLIKADFEANEEAYNGLKLIKALDHERKPRNTKN